MEGFNSAFVLNEDPNIPKGSKAYEVPVKQPCNSVYTTDRTRVTPTGRAIGEVIGVGQGHAMPYVKMEELFVGSDVFKMGQWRSVAAEPPHGGDEVCMN